MRLLDEDGKADGYTRLDLEEIVYLGVDSEYEKYLALLSGLNGGVSPDGGEDGGSDGFDVHGGLLRKGYWWFLDG